MKLISHLVLYGIVAVAQARPEAGYNYAQPQQTFQLSQSQLGSSYQQPNRLSGQASQQLQLSQSQQSSSYQQSLPQLTAPAVQYGAPNLQNLQSLNNQYLTPNLQLSQSSVAQQGALQAQHQYFAPSLQLSESSSAQQSSLQSQGFFSNFGAQQLPLVTKHIYVHVAPEESESIGVISPTPVVPRKHYKIIFIKAPQLTSAQEQLIHLHSAPQPVEEKTLVYVLVGKPQQSEIVIPTPAPTQPSKPEVYFIKYKSQKAAHNVNFESQGLQVNNDKQTINSGESTSSLFSGGLSGTSTKYGPPGY